jgi:hypothetical protein
MLQNVFSISSFGLRWITGGTLRFLGFRALDISGYFAATVGVDVSYSYTHIEMLSSRIV